MGEISSASHEQTQGIEQINQAITQMDQVTQQNAALVEEAAAAAASLQDQAGNLSRVVDIFTLATESAGRTAVRLPATARPAIEKPAREALASRASPAPEPSRRKAKAKPELATADGGWDTF
jgi:methyl-accepting chemotaxis protein